MSLKEWKKGNLGDLANIIMGQSPDGNSYNFQGEGLPLINGPVEFTKRYPIKRQWTNQITRTCKKGDILFCVRGSSTGRINIANDVYCIGRGVAAISSKNGAEDNAFIEQVLNHYLPSVLKLTTGSTFPSIDKNTLSQINISIPSLAERNTISTILFKWDEGIEKLERLIAAKEKLKQALMQQLLTGKKRFPKFVKTAKTTATKFGPIPQDWDWIPISIVAQQVITKNSSDRNLPVLSCTKYDGLVDSLEYFRRKVFGNDLSVYKVVAKGEFAYATNHIEEGSIGYQNIYDEALVSPMYTVFKVNEKVNPKFLFRVLKTELYRHIFEVSTSASVARRGGLRWDDFSQIKIGLPSLKEQNAIASFFDSLDNEINLHHQMLLNCKTQKQGMMDILLTGKLRVKGD